jgi:hypothetical protein
MLYAQEVGSIVSIIQRDKAIIRGSQTGRVPFAMTDEDWGILASLTEPQFLKDLPMRVAQRCLHLYKAGYLYTDSQGCVVLSLHGRRELGRRQRTQ